MKQVEHRYFDFTRPVEVRESVTDNGKKTIAGYASVFNLLSEDFGGFRERILPGAFDETLSTNQNFYALWNHDSNFPLASRDAGNLRLSVDATGLLSEMDLLNTSYAKDLEENVRNRVVKKMSFGFYVDDEGWVEDGDMVVREIKKISLIEVSPVTFPAYPDTTLAKRQFEARSKELASKSKSNAHKAQEVREYNFAKSAVEAMKLRAEFLKLNNKSI
jgi:HK97 family phage prohead protease